MGRNAGGGQQKKSVGGGHKLNRAAGKKRATYKLFSRSEKNKQRKNITAARAGDPLALKRVASWGIVNSEIGETAQRVRTHREAKKAAAALKPENRERRRESKELRKKRQAARRGNLEILKELENADVQVLDIKSEAHLSAEALKGRKVSLGILKECYPETFKAVKAMIAEAQKVVVEIEAKKAIAEADVVINDIKAEAERRVLETETTETVVH